MAAPPVSRCRSRTTPATRTARRRSGAGSWHYGRCGRWRPPRVVKPFSRRPPHFLWRVKDSGLLENGFAPSRPVPLHEGGGRGAAHHLLPRAARAPARAPGAPARHLRLRVLLRALRAAPSLTNSGPCSGSTNQTYPGAFTVGVPYDVRGTGIPSVVRHNRALADRQCDEGGVRDPGEVNAMERH
jgi:hypothetical protein